MLPKGITSVWERDWQQQHLRFITSRPAKATVKKGFGHTKNHINE